MCSLIEALLPEHLKEVHSSLVMEKIPSERNSVINEEENTSSYNIEKIFEAFTFISKRRKSVGKESEMRNKMMEL
jgi:hypothetical protein